MDRLATTIRYDPDAKKNTEVEDLTDDFKGKDNAAFLAEVAVRLKELTTGPESEWFSASSSACIGLTGEFGLIGSAIRQAQSLLRVDRTPSLWSHSFLFHGDISGEPAKNRTKNSAWIWESTLEPATPFNHFIERNGVGARHIEDYTFQKFDLFREHCVPNMAVLAVGLRQEERDLILKRASDPNVDRLEYDLGALLGTWYAYITDTATRSNPLASGNAVYCSAYVQLAYDAAGIDLAPGAHLKNTSPEHIWQMARYLSATLRTSDKKGNVVPRPVKGWYVSRELTGCAGPIERGQTLFPQNLEAAMALGSER